jgi:probable rRNA maturation factor
MPAGDATLLFQHPVRRVRRRDLRQFLSELTTKLGGGRAVTCLISTDAKLRALNRGFRGQNHATDVLAFPAGPGQSGLGEIAISLDRAAEQAVARGHRLEEELRILMLHGILHLSGMDHETDGGRMARAEQRWRKRLGLPAGLIERARA